MNYDISKSVMMSFNDTVNRVTSELQKEGFGIITEIDLKSKFNEKLGKDFRNYKILGACNPKLAYEAVQKESHIGVMLPCMYWCRSMRTVRLKYQLLIQCSQ